MPYRKVQRVQKSSKVIDMFVFRPEFIEPPSRSANLTLRINQHWLINHNQRKNVPKKHYIFLELPLILPPVVTKTDGY